MSTALIVARLAQKGPPPERHWRARDTCKDILKFVEMWAYVHVSMFFAASSFESGVLPTYFCDTSEKYAILRCSSHLYVLRLQKYLCGWNTLGGVCDLCVTMHDMHLLFA